MGFTKGRGDDYFFIFEEGDLPHGRVYHRTLIPTNRENALKYADYIRQVVTGGLIIAKEGDVPPLPQEDDLG